MVTNSEITSSNPVPRKRAAKPKRPDGVQTFERYWSTERGVAHRTRAPEAYARRAWNRCTAQHAAEIARLKNQIDNLAGDLAGIRFTIASQGKDHARCLETIKAVLNMDNV